jgi:hypothetical protein
MARTAAGYGLTPDVAQRDYVAIRVAHAIASDPGVGEQMCAPVWAASTQPITPCKEAQLDKVCQG